MEDRIVELLERGSFHLRALARALGANPSMVHRKLKNLEKEGVISWRCVGVRKVLTLNRVNPKTRTLIELRKADMLIAKLGPFAGCAFSLTEELNKKFGRRLRLVSVFGSVAKRTWKSNKSEQSDLDVMVVFDKLPGAPLARMELLKDIELETRRKFPVRLDIVEYDLSDLRIADPLLKEIKMNRIDLLNRGVKL